MMTVFKRAIPALLLILLTACSSNSTFHTSADPGANGTVVVREQAVLRLAGGGAGQGTLTLHGWEYPFEISNMALSGIGPGDIQLEGDVYDIDDARDFEGTYTMVSAEVQAGKGAEGFWFKNQNGVRVHIRTEGQDLTVSVNSTGTVIKLK